MMGWIKIRPRRFAGYKLHRHQMRALVQELENRMLRCTVGDEMRSWQNALQSFFAHYKPEE